MHTKVGKPTCTYAKVESKCGNPCAGIRLDASSLCFFDRIAQSQVEIAGTDIAYWSQDVANSVKDPLYDEPIDRAWLGPFRMKAYVSYPDNNAEAREEGTRWVWTSQIWIPRKSLEDAGAPAPTEGDVIQFWDGIAFYQEDSVGDGCVPGAGMYFDVVNATHDGHLFDSGAFVGFRCDVSRRTEFTPERRLRE